MDTQDISVKDSIDRLHQDGEDMEEDKVVNRTDIAEEWIPLDIFYAKWSHL